jgi:hypothetical protein
MWRHVGSKILEKPAASIFVKMKASMLQRQFGMPPNYVPGLHLNKPKSKYLERIHYLY